MNPAGSVEWRPHGHRMQLLPQKALWWSERQILMVSDLHLAKAEHFRSKGIQIPATVDFQTLTNLTRLLDEFKPQSLLLLGDLFHSVPNKAWDEFARWLLEERAAGLPQAVLVKGNHDRSEDARYEAMGLEVVSQWVWDDVVCTHAPEDEVPKGRIVHVCGHLHPAAKMRGKGRQSLRLPCFHQSSTGCDAGTRLVLPAFGAFTGMHAMEPRVGAQVYPIAESSVLGPFKS